MQLTTEELASLRAQYDRCDSKMFGGKLADLDYSSELAGPGGCSICLFVPEGTPPEKVQAAADEAAHKHDVVELIARAIPREWVDDNRFQPASQPQGWIDAARWIVQNGCARRVIPETGQLVPQKQSGGMLLDFFSASAMVQVYDALKAANRAKLNTMDLRVAHRIVFQLIK